MKHNVHCHSTSRLVHHTLNTNTTTNPAVAEIADRTQGVESCNNNNNLINNDDATIYKVPQHVHEVTTRAPYTRFTRWMQNSARRRVAVDMDIHGYIHGYIQVWISDIGCPVDISMDIFYVIWISHHQFWIKFNSACHTVQPKDVINWLRLASLPT